jgi:cytochrome o ubiquinol oxidase operon protein cyoD
MTHTNEAHGTTRSYTIGFILSIVFTLAAYFSVTEHIFSGNLLLAILFGLALIQFFIQLVFFLHLGKESKPRWNLTIFSFMILVVVMIVAGSIWIMKNLDYHMRTPAETDKTIMSDEAIHE